MKAIILVTILAGTQAISGLLHDNKVPPETYLDFLDYAHYFKIPVEEHKITTQDGYVLTFYRIQSQSQASIQSGLPAVYLQHGLIDSGDTFIINYPDEAPALVLANAGFDVWVGNSRGNKYSKQHISLSTKSKEFWDFSWCEMSDFDLPAAFQYIAGVTLQQKIDYVGHSQGTLIMFAALSQKNQVIQKYLGKFVALAPVISIRHQGSSIIQTFSGLAKYQKMLQALGVHEVFQYTDPTSHIAATVCNIVPIVCSYTIKQLADMKPELDNMEHFSVVMGHYPAGTSVNDMAHFAQMVKYERFGIRRFDYGSKSANTKKYGTSEAPWYDLTNITGQIYLFYGNYDLLADEKDVLELIEVLKPNNPRLFAKKYEAGHGTFIWGDNRPVMKDLLEVLQEQL